LIAALVLLLAMMVGRLQLLLGGLLLLIGMMARLSGLGNSSNGLYLCSMRMSLLDVVVEGFNRYSTSRHFEIWGFFYFFFIYKYIHHRCVDFGSDL